MTFEMCISCSTVIVESFKDTPPLNDDSVIFNEKREAIGKVSEYFANLDFIFQLL